MDRGLSIGEFARITHLTIRMLRRYDEGGLLLPDEVDPSSGYRYYSLDQVPTAQAIRRFRELGMPTQELRDLLTSTHAAERDALIVTHLRRLEDQLGRTQEAIESLRALLGPGQSAEVTLATLPKTEVVAVQDVVSHDGVLDWYAAAMADLLLDTEGQRSEGPPGGRYAHELFTHGSGHALVYVPVRVAEPSDRVEHLTLPERPVAVVTHHGAHGDIDLSYATLGTWVTRQEIGAEGPVEEIYDVGPSDDPDPAKWRTRLAWPVSAL